MGVRDVLATQKNAVVKTLKHLMAQTDEANVLAAELVKEVHYSVVHLPVFDIENDVETILCVLILCCDCAKLFIVSHHLFEFQCLVCRWQFEDYASRGHVAYTVLC